MPTVRLNLVTAAAGLSLSLSLLGGCAGDSATTTETAASTSEDITTTGASTGVPTTGDPTTGEPETSAAPLTTTTDTTGTTEPPIECGNGVVEGDEACDDGNDDETDACLASCVVATCGDNFVQVDVEECDDGNADNTDECTDTCAAAKCGDGFPQPGEECDDGNVRHIV